VQVRRGLRRSVVRRLAASAAVVIGVAAGALRVGPLFLLPAPLAEGSARRAPSTSLAGVVPRFSGTEPLRRLARRRAAPWDGLVGSVLDPGYWKRQNFITANVRELLPHPWTKEDLSVAEFQPTGSLLIGYLQPPKKKDDEEKGLSINIVRYVSIGKVDDNVRVQMKSAGEQYGLDIDFAEWEPGSKSSVTELVDVALVNYKVMAQLGPTLGDAFKELRRLLVNDGRLILITDEDDEFTLGGSFEKVFEAQELKDLEELEGLSFETGTSAGQVLRDAKLRLMKITRDFECGLTLALVAPVVTVTLKDSKAPGFTQKSKKKKATGGVEKQRRKFG